MKQFYSLLISILLLSCQEREHSKDEIILDTKKIIHEARAFTFTQLPYNVQNKARNTFLFLPVGSKQQEIEKQNGYYLRLTLDNHLLAQASNDRGLWKEKDLLDTSNLEGLYGKYRNRPELFDENNQLIPITRKFEGYDLIHVVRQNKIDTTY